MAVGCGEALGFVSPGRLAGHAIQAARAGQGPCVAGGRLPPCSIGLQNPD